MNSKTILGTSGWSYKDWVGPFYPEGTKNSEFLTIYSQKFDGVEVDSTFYGIPRASSVVNWYEITPENFKFVLKVPGEVTHGKVDRRSNLDRVLRDPDGVFERFTEVVENLKEKLGVLLFQFPYFRVKEMDGNDFKDRLEAFLSRVPTTIRASVEIRNKGWIDDRYKRILSQFNVGATLIDHPYMPPPIPQMKLLGVTSDFTYIRLLGDRYGIEKKTKTWGQVVEDKSSQLKEWAEVIRLLTEREEVKEAYAFSNNHYAGHGPQTVRDLEEALKDAPF